MRVTTSSSVSARAALPALAEARPQLVPLCAALTVVVSWPFYVFGGSQAAYVTATAAAAIAAGILAARRSPHALSLLVAEMALLGPEARGELAPGSATLGSLRILDVSLAAGVAGLLLQGIPPRSWWAEKLRRLRRPIALAAGAMVLWSLALWVLNGVQWDSLSRADLRLLAVATSGAILVAGCRPVHVRQLLEGLTWIGGATALKAIALWASDLWTIGTQDRAQATANDLFDRVILVGGDTLLILAPAIGVLTFDATHGKGRRAAVLAAIVLSLFAVLLSQTRTSALVAVAVALGAWVVAARRRPLDARTAGIAAAAIATFGAAAVVTGTADRFRFQDAPHAGVLFRKDEVGNFFDLPARDLLLGQGIGGRFLSEDIRGNSVISGWAHAFPLWIVLKTGLIGLLVACGIFAWVLRRSLSAACSANGEIRERGLLATTVVAGVLLMSLSLGRAALPEGVILLALALGVLPASSRRLAEAA